MTVALSQEASLYLPDIGTQNWGALFNANLEQLDGGFILKLVAGETIEAWDAVYIKNDGKMYKAKADSLTTLPAIGIAIANVASSAEGKVRTIGWIDYDDTSKTALAADEGDEVYVSAAVGGELIVTAPANAQFIGIVKTPTTANITRIIINPMLLTKASVTFGKLTVNGDVYVNTSSTTALVIEDNGVKDNCVVVDTTTGRVGLGASPSGNEVLQIYADGTSGRMKFIASDKVSYPGLEFMHDNNENRRGLLRSYYYDSIGGDALDGVGLQFYATIANSVQEVLSFDPTETKAGSAWDFKDIIVEGVLSAMIGSTLNLETALVQETVGDLVLDAATGVVTTSGFVYTTGVDKGFKVREGSNTRASMTHANGFGGIVQLNDDATAAKMKLRGYASGGIQGEFYAGHLKFMADNIGIDFNGDGTITTNGTDILINPSASCKVGGTIKTTADQAWDLGAAGGGAPTPDSKIRVTVSGTDYDISAEAV